MATRFARALRWVPGAVVHAVAGRSPDRAAAFARDCGAARSYVDRAHLVEDRDVDIVYVATRNHAHHADCLAAIAARKAVLCEKPFALDASQAREIVAAARAQRVFCMEAMWMRFIPLVQEAVAAIRAGVIGEPQSLCASFGVPTARGPDSRHYRLDHGGGALLDRGVYGVSLGAMLFGAVESVVGAAVGGGTGVDEETYLWVRYRGGRQASVAASLRGLWTNEASIHGSGGRLVLHEPFYRPDRMTIRCWRGDGGDAGGDRGMGQRLRTALRESALARRVHSGLRRLGMGWCRGADRTVVRPHAGNGYQFQAAEVVRCLRTGALESPVMPLDETIAVLEVMDAARAQWHPRTSVVQDSGGAR